MTAHGRDARKHPSKPSGKRGGAPEHRPRPVERRKKAGLGRTLERLSYVTALVMTCLMFVAVGITWMSRPPRGGIAPGQTDIPQVQAELPAPTQPVEPAQPDEPEQPDEPAQPTEAAQPAEPEQPVEPAQPAEPEQPAEPVEARPAHQGVVPKPLSASTDNTAVILDGKARITGDNTFGQCDTDAWPEVASVCLGNEHAMGLTPAGEIVCAGSDEQRQCELEAADMPVRSIAAGPYASYAVMEDGTLRMSGSSVISAQSLGQVTDAVDIAAAQTHVLVLKADGTVAAFGDKRDGACDVDDWHDIAMIACGYGYSLGLDASGKVWFAGDGGQGRGDIAQVNDAQSIAAGTIACYAVRRDGTVAAAGSNGSDQLNVTGWTGVKAVAGGYLHAAAITEDGSVLIAGRDPAQ